MIEYLKFIYTLILLKNKTFRNTIIKAGNWSKIITIVLLLFLFLNAIQSSSLTFQYIKDNFNENSDLFRSLFSLILFMIFISNIFTTLFLGGSNNSSNLFKTLLHYPVRFNRIVSYEIISGLGDVINLLYLPFYVAAIFILHRLSGGTEIITFLIILLLFLFSVSGIIYLLKNLFTLISCSKHPRKLLYSLYLLFGIIFIVIIQRLPLFLKDTNNLILAGNALRLFPTGVYSNFILNPQSSLLSYNFLFTLLYFLALNILLFVLNYRIVKFFKNKTYGRVSQKLRHNTSLLTRLFIRVPINPFTKKDIMYTLRHFNTMRLHFLMAVFIPVLIIAYIINDNNGVDIISQISISILFMSLLVLRFSGNFFSFEENAIINYFIRPINNSSIIKSKTFIANYYFVIILLTNLILLLILQTKFSVIIFYDFLILLNYFLLLLFTIPLSIFSPKKVKFNVIIGNVFPTQLSSLFMFFIFAFILWFISKTTLTFYFYFNNKFLIFLILCFMLLSFIYYKEKIFSRLGTQLSKRKEKIIMVFK